MDDTQTNKESEAGATRKRRSSILKNQRAPRTPFSDLEFNVATPTDTAKSRRVSFSKRMGVAEFATNTTGTTTWTNFYEEQNKSLESSGHDSIGHAARPSMSHIGRRIFEQQFEEVEAVCLSINNINVTQQLGRLECGGDDMQLPAPHQHFELSSLTEHQTKLFGNDLTVPAMGEMSNPINVDFSVVNAIGKADGECDDLDEMQRDLDVRRRRVVCPGPFPGDVSEYIEVDLNVTHVAVRDESNMSMTDTAERPKVEGARKSDAPVAKPKKSIVGKDWEADKENIAAINPYVTPCETDNFAVNDEPDEVLVFDGKRLTVQCERRKIGAAEVSSNGEGYYRQSLFSDAAGRGAPQRRTIVLNDDDDIPNFIGDRISSQRTSVAVDALKHTVIFDEAEISVTQAIPNKIDVIQRKTDCDDLGNMSLTQVVPANVIIERNCVNEKRRTIVYENNNNDISVTQAVPNNVLFEKPVAQIKRRTTVYDDSNMSFTRMLSANAIVRSDRTVKCQSDVDVALLATEAGNKTAVELDTHNMSMTEVLPANIVISDSAPIRRNATVYEDIDGNMSMTQAVPQNLILAVKSENVNKTQSILFENDTADISMTEMVPAKVIHEICNGARVKVDLQALNVNHLENVKDVAVSETVAHKHSPKKHLTVMYDDDIDMSITQVPLDNVFAASQQSRADNKHSIVYDGRDGDLSMTQALPSNILLKDNCETKIAAENVIFHNHDVSMTPQMPPHNQSLASGVIIDNHKRNINDKSVNEMKFNFSANVKHNVESNLEMRKSVTNDMSITKPIPNNIIDIGNILKNDLDKFIHIEQLREKALIRDNKPDDIFIYQASAPDPTDLKEKANEMKGGESDVQNLNSSSVKCIKSNVSPATNEFDAMEENDVGIQTDSVKDKNSNPIESSRVDLAEFGTENSRVIQEAKRKQSILHELLDMSNTSVDDIMARNRTTDVATEFRLEDGKPDVDSDSNSNGDMFVITKDSREIVHIGDNINDDLKDVEMLENEKCIKGKDSIHEISRESLPALEFNSKCTDVDNQLDDKLVKFESGAIKQEIKSPPGNRHYEIIVSSDLQESLEKVESDKTYTKDATNGSKTRKSFKEADDTKELLEMLSDFTDRKSCAPTEGSSKPVLPINLNRSVALKQHPDMVEPRRLSLAPKRQSIVLNRENLLNDLSMAQATLQQSRFDINSDSIEDTDTESPIEMNESPPSAMKSARMSKEVVKTLHFEDESCSDASWKGEMKVSALKKTAFGETSYMTESKANVIPAYWKDVSDNLKAIMNDLVKPRPDQMPFEAAISTNNPPSTCSTQIQANLVTSSQIDLDVGLHSNVNSTHELRKVESLGTDVANAGINPRESLKSPERAASVDAPETYILNESQKRARFAPSSALKKTAEGPVLVFDHQHPLNNVLLAPSDCLEVHRYNPVNTSEVLKREENLEDARSDGAIETDGRDADRVTAQYRVESRVRLRSGDAASGERGDSRSLFSDPSKPLSTDRSTDGIAMDVKDTEVNTVIVMKANKELLEASSSLTLVDDTLNNCALDTAAKAVVNVEKSSPVKVIYKIDDEEASLLDNMDSDLVSNDEEPIEHGKVKKRSYSPPQYDTARSATASTPDVTPKPLSKIQKMSTSPNVYKNANPERTSADKSESSGSDNLPARELRKTRSPRKSKDSPRHKKPGADVTVQQLVTEYRITKMEQDAIEAIHERMSSGGSATRSENSNTELGPGVLSSCTSSKNQSETDARAAQSASLADGRPSAADWQPELHGLGSESLVTECDSGVNVVAKIDMLPFMGSSECEWEASRGDTWLFRLLRARLRLRVRLAHRPHNAPRSRVRADTPIAETSVYAVDAEEKDTLVALCVRLAADAMRYECARGWARAGDAPRLLRRCAGVARAARRWAAAMRDARARLAYTLSADGVLSLKVANIPLRSVWEVRMRLELTVEDAREGAWPRAGDVRVLAVVSDRPVAPADVQRALAPVAHDWAHVPRTVWKIFRYLKNKTRDDDFLGVDHFCGSKK